MANWIKMAILLVGVVSLSFVSTQELPTVYEYFTEGGVQSGFASEALGEFKLNGKPLRIISGAIHYFRVHPSSWRDSMKKLRATGATAVETYVAWNFHEPRMDQFDFGAGGNEFSEFADIVKFIKMAQEEDLLVILRPGPYICGEWEYGGYPSWLLRDPDMRLRGSYQGHLDRVKKFFDQLLPLMRPLQFTQGGPIIALQLENEYAYFDKPDKEYVTWLANLYRTSGFEDTLLFTADGPHMGDRGTIDGVLWTGNYNRDVQTNIDRLNEIQPNKGHFVMEYWPGWYDVWQKEHDTGLSVQDFKTNLEIMMTNNASVNFFMIHGGTNFGFMAGGEFGGNQGYSGMTTSYDYDAPLSESADYTEKYNVVVELANKYTWPKLKKPVQPLQQVKESYDTVLPQKYLTYNQILDQVPLEAQFHMDKPTNMEALDMNQGSGQSYGYIVHRFNSSTVTTGSLYKAGLVQDFGTVVVDGKVQWASFNGDVDGKRYWIHEEREIALEIDENLESHTLDLMVENMGRIKIGSEDEMRRQKKGLPNGHIYLNGVEVNGFDVFALEFNSAWVKSLTNFQDVTNMDALVAPLIVQSTFVINGEPHDTFLDLENGWHKGVAFVNGFNLGRYFKVGPQHRLYVPRGVLKTGENTVTIFEQLEVGKDIKFQATPQISN